MTVEPHGKRCHHNATATLYFYNERTVFEGLCVHVDMLAAAWSKCWAMTVRNLYYATISGLQLVFVKQLCHIISWNNCVDLSLPLSLPARTSLLTCRAWRNRTDKFPDQHKLEQRVNHRMHFTPCVYLLMLKINMYNVCYLTVSVHVEYEQYLCTD